MGVVTGFLYGVRVKKELKVMADKDKLPEFLGAKLVRTQERRYLGHWGSALDLDLVWSKIFFFYLGPLLKALRKCVLSRSLLSPYGVS